MALKLCIIAMFQYLYGKSFVPLCCQVPAFQQLCLELDGSLEVRFSWGHGTTYNVILSFPIMFAHVGIVQLYGLKLLKPTLMDDFSVFMLQDEIAQVNRKIQERIARRKAMLLQEDSYLIR